MLVRESHSSRDGVAALLPSCACSILLQLLTDGPRVLLAAALPTSIPGPTPHDTRLPLLRGLRRVPRVTFTTIAFTTAVVSATSTVFAAAAVAAAAAASSPEHMSPTTSPSPDPKETERKLYNLLYAASTTTAPTPPAQMSDRVA